MDHLGALTIKAVEISSILNALVDDDERESAQELFERELNNRLFEGSIDREEAFSRAVPS